MYTDDEYRRFLANVDTIWRSGHPFKMRGRNGQILTLLTSDTPHHYFYPHIDKWMSAGVIYRGDASDFLTWFEAQSRPQSAAGNPQ